MSARPLLRYHGGKWRLAEWIAGHFPAHRCYTEVYGGGGSVLLRKPRSRAEIYNDVDGEVVNLFRVVRDDGERLARLIAATPYALTEFQESTAPADDAVEQARRTLVRGWMGYSTNALAMPTGFRSYSGEDGTSPARDWMRMPEVIAGHLRRLRGVVIECREAVEVLRQHDSPETLHYVDPPYVLETRMRGAGTEQRGYRHEMTDAQHETLAGVLSGLVGMVVVSGYPSALYARLFTGWRCVERAAQASGAKPRTECLWLKNIPQERGLFTE